MIDQRKQHGESEFQSSIAPKGNRYCKLMTLMTDCTRFQSSIAPKGNRYGGKQGDRSTQLEFQSSIAPKGNRYQRLLT